MLYESQATLALGIPDVRIITTRLAREQEVIIEVESTLTTIACRRCGRTINEFDGYAEAQTVRYLPPSGQLLVVSFRPKRFRCQHCDNHPTTIQQLEWPADIE